MAGHLTEADPIPITRAWLLASPLVTEALGGPDRVSAHNEPPYPCAVLTDVPGSDRGLRHLIAPLVQVEVIGDVDGTPGKPALRRALYTILERLRDLPETEQTDPTLPIVTAVVSTGGGGWSPLPTGQPRYLATVQVYMHPPRVIPTRL